MITLIVICNQLRCQQIYWHLLFFNRQYKKIFKIISKQWQKKW
nr:MAG TPA: 14-3-3 protein zeta/delta [Herelleviridae sp.]